MALFDKKEKSSNSVDGVSISIDRDEEAQVDGVFGKVTEDSKRYTNVGWFRAAVLLMKAQIGLGVLGIPSVFSSIGMVPGIICILVIAAMTTWSSFVVGTFKLRHPEVHSIADVGFLLFGPIGREVLGAIYWLYMICISGSGMLGVSIALNTLSDHGTCTVVFVAVAAIAIFLLSSVQTLDRVTWLGWIGLVSIMASVITVSAAVGVQDRPSLAPPTGPWDKQLKMFGSPTFAEAASALGTIVFAFAGTPAFFNVVAEMRNPKDFAKTVIVCQSFVTVTYLVIGCVVYYFCGEYVASPALGSAGILLKKICYGLALPALLVGAMIYTHLPAKYIFVRILRGTDHLTRNTATHWIVWLGSVFACTIVAFVIAEGVPVFGGLVGLVGALFGTIMSMQVMGLMWLFDNWSRRHSDKSTGYRALVAWNLFLVVAGSFLTIGGTYGSIDGLIQSSRDAVLVSFSCADNS